LAKIRGTSKSDRLYGTDRDDIIHGLAGDDLIWGRRGDDTIYTGAGSDTAKGGGGNDTIRTSSGFNNSFHGGADDDDLSVAISLPTAFPIKTWQTQLDGGAGNDVLSATYDRPGFFGGEGDVYNNVIGGAGNDSVYVRVGQDQGGYLLESIVSNWVAGGDGDDELVALAFSLFGSGNRIDGGIGNDAIQSISEVAELKGGDGHDRIISESLRSTISGGEGDDHIDSSGDFPSYDVTFVASEQSVSGGGGNDYLSVHAETYGNVLGAAAATATGDSGDDLINVNLISGSWFGGETLTNVDGGSGNDSIVVESTAIQFEADGDGARAANVVHGASGDDFVYATATIEEAAGSGGRHVAINRIYGGDGDDILTARIDLPEAREGICSRAERATTSWRRGTPLAATSSLVEGAMMFCASTGMARRPWTVARARMRFTAASAPTPSLSAPVAIVILSTISAPASLRIISVSRAA
jgi:Ca2+-binding RTX toxin-like protein